MSVSLVLSLFYNNPLFKDMAPWQVHLNLRIHGICRRVAGRVAGFYLPQVCLQANLGGRKKLHHLKNHGLQVSEDGLQGDIRCEIGEPGKQVAVKFPSTFPTPKTSNTVAFKKKAKFLGFSRKLFISFISSTKAGGGSETVDTSEEEQTSWSASDQEAWSIWVFPKIRIPPKHPKMIIFSRKTHGCWVPPFLETSIVLLLVMLLRIVIWVNHQSNLRMYQCQYHHFLLRIHMFLTFFLRSILNASKKNKPAKEVKDLAEMAVKIEKHYGRPMERLSGGWLFWWMVVVLGVDLVFFVMFFFVENVERAVFYNRITGCKEHLFLGRYFFGDFFSFFWGHFFFWGGIFFFFVLWSPGPPVPWSPGPPVLWSSGPPQHTTTQHNKPQHTTNKQTQTNTYAYKHAHTDRFVQHTTNTPHRTTKTPPQNTTTRTPPQKHHHTTTKTPPQKHHHKNTTTKTPPQEHHHKNTTTPPQKHHHTTTKTPPQEHHHKNNTTRNTTKTQKHHHKNTTKTPPQEQHH